MQKVSGEEAVSEKLCGTCKWARPVRKYNDGRDDIVDRRLAAAGFPLTCELAEMDHPESLAPSRMCVTMDGSEYRGDLYVKPNFGCVQWEAKP
jgi:hypothetical protein